MLTGRVPAVLSLPRTRSDRAPFFRPGRLVKIREEIARGGAVLDVNEPVGCPARFTVRRLGRAGVPSLRLGPVEKLLVRGTNLIIFINRRSSAAAREGGGGGEGEARAAAAAEVKVGAARGPRGRMGEGRYDRGRLPLWPSQVSE